MCKLTDKPLYASGFGIQLLTNFCAVGNRKITVINGREKGGDLESLKHYSAKSFRGSEVFLDNCTGDFFEPH
jgi:predicted site-specific integrase-resolvase